MSVSRHEHVDRDSTFGFDQAEEQAGNLQRVRDPLEDAAEDFGARGAAWLPIEQAACQAQTGAVYTDHPRDSQTRPEGTEEATAHGEADLRALA